MRDKFHLFVADVTRYGSVAALTLATLLCVPSLEEFFAGTLGATSILARFLVAFAIATFGVRIATRTLLHYAHENLTSHELDLAEANTSESETA